MSISAKRILSVIWDYAIVTVGTLLYCMGWTSFLIPNGIASGGGTGLCTIVYFATGIPVSYSFFVLNALLLIIGFNYFYIAMQYNPVQIANDLKKNNGAIPGYRPGKPTSDFIHNSLSKVTLVGAIFLGIIAIFPIIFQNLTGITGLSLGGTTILIVVGVALEMVQQLESLLIMRHYKGFLD